MKRVFLIIVLVAMSRYSFSGEISCPKGTTPGGKTTPLVTEAWCEDSNHEFQGPYRAWWPNGQLGTEGQYKHNVQVGKWRGWYKTGELQREEWYENGKKVKSRQYDKKGHVNNKNKKDPGAC